MSTNRALFDLLYKARVVQLPLTESLYAMAGFRTVLVRGYQEVDVTIVEDTVRSQLGDLLAFVAAIRRDGGSV